MRNILSYGLRKLAELYVLCLFIQYKGEKGEIFTTVLEKDKSNGWKSFKEEFLVTVLF